MNIKTPFDHLRELSKETNKHTRDLFKYVFEKLDSISIWIIGFSIGGITVFANNIGGIQEHISLCILKIILILLAISIASGILFRIVYITFLIHFNNALFMIDVAFTDTQGKVMPTESRLTGSESFNQLIELLKNEFGDDLFYLIPIYEQIDEGQKDLVRKSVIKHYNANINWAKDVEAGGINFIANTYHKFLGTPKEDFFKETNQGSAKKFKSYQYIITSLYFIYISTFIAALFTFAFAAK